MAFGAVDENPRTCVVQQARESGTIGQHQPLRITSRLFARAASRRQPVRPRTVLGDGERHKGGFGHDLVFDLLEKLLERTSERLVEPAG